MIIEITRSAFYSFLTSATEELTYSTDSIEYTEFQITKAIKVLHVKFKKDEHSEDTFHYYLILKNMEKILTLLDEYYKTSEDETKINIDDVKNEILPNNLSE